VYDVYQNVAPKRDEVTGEWRKLHSEIHILYSSSNIIRQPMKENEVGGTCGTHGRGEKSVQGFGGKARRRRPLGRPRRRWEDGIRMDLTEIGWRSVEWIQLAQDRNRWRALVNTAMNLRALEPRSYTMFIAC
jgi:hypothetical protein